MNVYGISHRLTIAACTGLLCGAVAFAQSNMSTTQGNVMSHGTQAGAAQASHGDKMFAKKAMEGGMAEVQLGQLAAQNGGSDDVKQFGQRMVDDHTKLNNQMQPIAEQIGVTPPTQLSPKDQALMTKLQGQSGKQFDDTYIRAMVKDHRMDLKEFRKEANSGQNPQLKDAAASGADVIQQHLQLVEQLAQTHNVSVPGPKGNGMGNGSGQ